MTKERGIRGIGGDHSTTTRLRATHLCQLTPGASSIDRSSSDIARSAWPCSTSHTICVQCGIAVSIAALSGVAPTQCRHLQKRPEYPRWLVQAPARARKIATHSRGPASPCRIAHGLKALRTCGQPVAGGEGYGCNAIASGTGEQDKIDVSRCSNHFMAALMVQKRARCAGARDEGQAPQKRLWRRGQYNAKAV